MRIPYPNLAKRWAVLALALLGASPASAQQQPVVVLVVRHAERAEDGTNDPPISAAGAERSRLLAYMLRGTGITHIHTTAYERTRQTAAPVAEAASLLPSIYEADRLDDLAELLRSAPGKHLVVGHSNTVPALVELLGGDAYGQILADEYDRLYVLTLTADATTTTLLRFGTP